MNDPIPTRGRPKKSIKIPPPFFAVRITVSRSIFIPPNYWYTRLQITQRIVTTYRRRRCLLPPIVLWQICKKLYLDHHLEPADPWVLLVIMVYIAADGSVGGKKSLWTRITDFFQGTIRYISFCVATLKRNVFLAANIRVCFSILICVRSILLQRFFCSFHYSFQL